MGLDVLVMFDKTFGKIENVACGTDSSKTLNITVDCEL